MLSQYPGLMGEILARAKAREERQQARAAIFWRVKGFFAFLAFVLLVSGLAGVVTFVCLWAAERGFHFTLSFGR